MNTRKINQYIHRISLFLTLLACFVVLGSCALIRSSSDIPPLEQPKTEMTSEIITESTETETENEVTETDTEGETTEVTSEETTEITSEETTTEQTYYEETMVFEEILFGEYIPPETEPAETFPPLSDYDPDFDFPMYDPTVPSGDGYAPLSLMYHLVLDEPFSELESLFVRPSELEGHIQALIEKDYAFIFADEYDYSDRKTVIMSFDDGYVDNYTEMFPIIQKYNVKVTVFMVAGYIGGDGFLTEDMIKEMSDSGLVSFQSHTNSHSGLTSLSPDSVRYEFEASKNRIEGLTGREVKAICYPSGRYNDAVLGIAEEYFEFGYTTVSRTSTEGFPVLELPRLRVSRGMNKSYFKSVIP